MLFEFRVLSVNLMLPGSVNFLPKPWKAHPFFSNGNGKHFPRCILFKMMDLCLILLPRGSACPLFAVFEISDSNKKVVDLRFIISHVFIVEFVFNV